MTTYVLLALTDDGRVTAYPWELHMPCNPWPVNRYLPEREGNDRGQFVTFEIAGYSIDVVRLPEVKL